MLYRALITIMNNEKKIQEVKKEAGGDEKLIFKFAWPNTQNRDDHCPQHTNTLSYHKEMPHFKMHKVVLEVGTRYVGGKEEFVVCFRDPPPPPPP